MKEYCFGIDVGGTTVKCGLFHVDGTLEEKWEIPTRTENHGREILPDIAASIRAKMQERGIVAEEVAGVGLGVPGPVNDKGEIPCAVNLNWGYKHISKEMEDLTGLPAKAANDANAAALGEAWKGGAEGASWVVMATLGTGVGGGIIVDGKIVSGAHGAGGEIGHMNMAPDEEEACNCGNQGCLEQMASATGIVRLARRELERDAQDSILRGVDVTAKAVFDAYKQGDGLAGRVVDQFAGYLGRGLAMCACVMDPEVILIGGGVTKAGEPLLEAVQREYQKAAFAPCKDTPLRLAKLGNDAGIYGAAKLALYDI